MIVAPQAFTDRVEVVKPVFLVHAKGQSYVGQRLSRNQIMECGNNDNYYIWDDSTYIDCLLHLLQYMLYVNHNPGVRLLRITVLHGDAFNNENITLLSFDIHNVGWWPAELCNLGKPNSKVPSCSLSHEGSPSNCLAVRCRPTLSCAHTLTLGPCRFIQTVRGIYVSCNIQTRDTLPLLLQSAK